MRLLDTKDDELEVRLPATAYGLIELLDRSYPQRNISPPPMDVHPMSHYAAAQRAAGVRDLIDELLAIMEAEKADDQESDDE